MAGALAQLLAHFSSKHQVFFGVFNLMCPRISAPSLQLLHASCTILQVLAIQQQQQDEHQLLCSKQLLWLTLCIAAIYLACSAVEYGVFKNASIQ
jgi:hypothetical protein